MHGSIVALRGCVKERNLFVTVIETIKTSSLNTKLKVAYICIVVHQIFVSMISS
jgi:hypothetical protein